MNNMQIQICVILVLMDSSKWSANVCAERTIKAKKTGFPLGILRQVFNRGVAAWKKGHVPGTTPAQWGMARVNSFATGGRTTEVSDGALYRQAKKARAERRKKKK